MNTQVRTYIPFRSPFDPCPPMTPKAYMVPPQLFMGFQPAELAQFTPMEALQYGVLWPALYSPYPVPIRVQQEGQKS